MKGIAFPVYVLSKDDGRVIAFQRFTEMQGYLESIDVENHEYEAWDANGRCIEFATKDSKRDWLEIIPTGRSADERDFAATRGRAEACPKWAPLSSRFLRWLGRS